MKKITLEMERNRFEKEYGVPFGDVDLLEHIESVETIPLKGIRFHIRKDMDLKGTPFLQVMKGIVERIMKYTDKQYNIYFDPKHRVTSIEVDEFPDMESFNIEDLKFFDEFSMGIFRLDTKTNNLYIERLATI